jgi:hypothetical protein
VDTIDTIIKDMKFHNQAPTRRIPYIDPLIHRTIWSKFPVDESEEEGEDLYNEFLSSTLEGLIILSLSKE